MNAFTMLRLVAVALLAWAGTASAASTGTTFNVTTEVQPSCQVSATNLAFGVYNPANLSNQLASSTLTVVCSLGTPYTVSLNYGSNAQGNGRRMGNGPKRIQYELYRDATRTQVFGTVADTLGTSGVGTGSAQVHTVYGSIPAAQNVEPGSYSDQVTVTLDY